MSQHAGRTIGIAPELIDGQWTALVEIWLVDTPQTHRPHVMPFSLRFNSEFVALDEALHIARRYIDVHRLGVCDIPGPQPGSIPSN